MDALIAQRLQFAFTITYHYLFPQLTMGLALLIFVLKTQSIFGDAKAGEAARFWIRVFGLSFVFGVVTGIPMEFQFGTGWSRFSEAAGGVIGQTLAMEGVFAFFLESSFLYLLLFQEKRIGPKAHWAASLLLFFGTWLSGYFIVTTNAFMQHPRGHQVLEDGRIVLASLSDFLLNPWALVQYIHTMNGAVITGSFAMAALSSYYLLQGVHTDFAKKSLRLAVWAGLASSLFAAFPTGDWHAKMLYRHQPVTFAAMEGIFNTEAGAGLVLIGQPNVEAQTLDNPIEIPKFLSFLTHRRWNAEIHGLNEFDRSLWPDNIPLVYFSYRIMAGLGTFFILAMAAAAFFLIKGKLFGARPVLWVLMLAFPFPFIANTAGWTAAEVGRQPWIIYGLMKTADGHSAHVSSGNVWFTLLGFMGLYSVLSMLFFFLMLRLIQKGPESETPVSARELH